jgi:hypothetical protein
MEETVIRIKTITSFSPPRPSILYSLSIVGGVAMVLLFRC